jgi:hypothetical protein
MEAISALVSNLMLSQFTNNRPPNIEESAVESLRFGVNIGRLLVPFSSPISDSEIAALCSESAFKLIFVRAHSSRNLLAESLSFLPAHRSLHADSLLYFGQSLCALNAVPIANPAISSMGTLKESEHESFIELVRETFASYVNHYSANSLLPKHLALDGYVEWVSTLLVNTQGRIFVARNSKEQLLSFIAIQSDGQTVEIILNGTSPSAQGLGIYPTLLSFVCSELFNLGFHELVTSTQSSNSNVMKVWINSGFNYLAAINTFHVIKN